MKRVIISSLDPKKNRWIKASTVEDVAKELMDFFKQNPRGYWFGSVPSGQNKDHCYCIRLDNSGKPVITHAVTDTPEKLLKGQVGYKLASGNWTDVGQSTSDLIADGVEFDKRSK